MASHIKESDFHVWSTPIPDDYMWKNLDCVISELPKEAPF